MTPIFSIKLLHSKCETWVVREGYEGLVLGNSEESRNADSPGRNAIDIKGVFSHIQDPIVKNLRFGDGELLKNGEGDAYVADAKGRTLKGRYIIHVGWDDVRGWLSEVR